MRAHLFVLFACVAVAFAGDFSSPRYQDQTASQKANQLWAEIKADTTPYGWYSKLSAAGLFFLNMKTSFDTYSDVLPEGRKKLIHSVGSVVQVRLVQEASNPYTGMFKGVNNALIRISAAKAYDPKSPAKGNFLPGMGIKLLRNKMPSANLVAMYSLDGQDSWNVFKNDWSHHVANPCSFALKIAQKKFATATPLTGRIGIRTWAEYDEQGKKVAESDIKVPFRLFFRPASAVKNMFPDNFVADVNEQLATIPANTDLFDLYAVPKPHADAVKIGTFKTKSRFTTSKFGDKDLYFQHNYEEDDLKLHPEWKAAVEVDPPISVNLV